MQSSYENHLKIKRERCERLRAELAEKYPQPCSIILEIGCGHGHYLTAFAQNHPEETCLGVDLVTKRIEKANAKKDKRMLQNVHFHKAEIKELMDCLPTSIELKRVFILFPDPWPKKRHAKNRIIQDELLDLIAQKGNMSTKLHFRTDHEGQFEWGMERIGSNRHWTLNDEEEWPFENASFFQDMMDDYYSLTALRCELGEPKESDNNELGEDKSTNEGPSQQAKTVQS